MLILHSFSLQSPPKNVFVDLEKAIGEAIDASGLIAHPTWVAKIVQLHETCLVRHGIMVVGPAAGGKSKIMETLQTALLKTTGIQHKIVRLNPKSVTSQELFGQTDPQSGEWETGVFASVWQKFNQRSLPYTTWITCDGPVDSELPPRIAFLNQQK
jgi:dynein heavy chain, axonemal